MVPRGDTAFPVWVGALKFRLAIIVTVFELLILVVGSPSLGIGRFVVV